MSRLSVLAERSEPVRECPVSDRRVPSDAVPVIGLASVGWRDRDARRVGPNEVIARSPWVARDCERRIDEQRHELVGEDDVSVVKIAVADAKCVEFRDPVDEPLSHQLHLVLGCLTVKPFGQRRMRLRGQVCRRRPDDLRGEPGITESSVHGYELLPAWAVWQTRTCGAR